jgi:PhoH-like ATPase
VTDRLAEPAPHIDPQGGPGPEEDGPRSVRGSESALAVPAAATTSAAPGALATSADARDTSPPGRRAATRTTYILDTCVLLADPGALFRFAEHDVVVPLVVVEELDRQKNRPDELGANARRAVRSLEDLRVANGGALTEAVALPGEGSLRVESNHLDIDLPAYIDPTRPDSRILAVALGTGGVLVTKDVALRLKAAQLGAETQDYRADTVEKPVEEVEDGVHEVDLPGDALDVLHRDGAVPLGRATVGGSPVGELPVNTCAVVRGGGLARVVDRPGGRWLSRVAGDRSAFGVRPRDARQTLAMDLLMDPSVPCVSLMGMAGTGKTFLAIAAGIEQVMGGARYRRLSVYRPLVAVGRQELGYLPGDLDEKLAPWMAAVHDNLHALFRREGGGDHRAAQRAVDGLIERGQLEMASVTYLRGRSITDEYVIVDEAQNLELATLKVILTRMGEGSKVVFCGDTSQIDNPYLSPAGGLAALVDRMRGTPLFGHVRLTRGQRSPLAELAATAL